ncbi:hypothetical protein ACA910_022619 [Epithemia clementina (nom. ined.)]
MSFLIWRPLVPDIGDGQPLARQISELWEFPQHRIYVDDQAPWISLLLRPEWVLAVMGLFVLSLPLVTHGCQLLHIGHKSERVRWCTAAHNLILAIFSGICAWNTYALTLEHVWTHGWWSTYCNIDNVFWSRGMGAWNTIFFLSKFYELGDTWLLLAKGKPATFLQVYHHALMIAAMWGGVVTQAPWLFIVVALNSVIHTFMYIYFYIKTVRPQTEIKSAKYLTMAQITQFFTGIFLSIPYYILDYGTCRTFPSSIFMLAFFHLYGVSLILLFTAFAKQKYNSKPSRNGSTKKATVHHNSNGTTTTHSTNHHKAEKLQ